MEGKQLHCPVCDRDVPTADYCVSCGHRFAGGRGGAGERFAAAPNERLWVPRLASTLFPQLPRAAMWPFRIALALGIVVVALLALAGLYPVALAAAVVLVPAELALYLYAVDIYEDARGSAVSLSLGWGIVTGALFGLATERWVPAISLLDGVTARDVLIQSFVVPVAGVAIALGGPLWLRRDTRFDDTLDGVTFGGLAGCSLIGIAALTHAWQLLESGLHPEGPADDWLIRLLELGVLAPVTWAAAVGVIAAAIWRRPQQRPAHAHPLAVIVAALALVCAAAYAQLQFGRNAALATLVVLALLALVVLRLLIQRGLRDEAGERATGDDLVCANCHHPTPRNMFCGHCGIALDALPKAPGDAPRGDAAARIGRIAIVTLTAAVILTAGAVTAVLANVREVPSAPPPCPAPPLPCSPPVGNAPLLATRLVAAGGPAGHVFRADTGFSFQYPDYFPITGSGSNGAAFAYKLMTVVVTSQGDTDPEQAVSDQLKRLGLLGVRKMAASEAPPSKPLVGLRRAAGGFWVGTESDGVSVGRQVRVAIAAAQSGGLTIVTTAYVGAADENGYFYLGTADDISNTIHWPGQLGA